MHRRAVAQAVVARDHDTASTLAQLALPTWRPEIDGAELFARSDPARLAGGDLFAFAIIDGLLHFVVGDVSGKGLPAGLMMTMVISASNAAFQTHGAVGPAAVMKAIDRSVYGYLSDGGLFVTLLVGSFDPSGRRLRLSNAGHSPVFYVHDGHASSVDASVPPIGVLPLDDVAETDVALQPGDRLVVASDGFTEQADPSGEHFGEVRLAALISATGRRVGELGSHLFELIEEYQGAAAQSDDRTLLILDIDGTE
jgi:serine phosphatase RsbU (regulator of sigma subunit)